MTRKLDPEIKALKAVNRALKPLDARTRRRLLTWRVNYDAKRTDVVLPPFPEQSQGKP